MNTLAAYGNFFTGRTTSLIPDFEYVGTSITGHVDHTGILACRPMSFGIALVTFVLARFFKQPPQQN